MTVFCSCWLHPFGTTKKALKWLVHYFPPLVFFLEWWLGFVYQWTWLTFKSHTQLYLCSALDLVRTGSIYISFLCFLKSWFFVFGSLILNKSWTSVKHLSLTQNSSLRFWNSFLLNHRGHLTFFLQPGARWCEGCTPLCSFQTEVLSFAGVAGPDMKPLLYLLSLLAFVCNVMYKMERLRTGILDGHGRSLWLL